MSVLAKTVLWIQTDANRGDPPVWAGAPETLEIIWHTFDVRPFKTEKLTLADGRWGRVSEIDHRPDGLLISVRMYDEVSKQGLTEAPSAVPTEEAESR